MNRITCDQREAIASEAIAKRDQLLALQNAAMPLSSKEKQAAFRERKKEQELFEVRGIFLPKDMHEKLKVLAEKLAKPKKEPKK